MAKQPKSLQAARKILEERLAGLKGTGKFCMGYRDYLAGRREGLKTALTLLSSVKRIEAVKGAR